ncbi:hypothetical protein PF002_g24098 [Phytophthora fragariae]|uniref:Elicitin n=1 Tax=Phytophthora fragariae TaxID=53985 RepID=A0A6A3WYA1_9STRA|nr:hypothetical protein PF002_g24098 [Phytophthora fragariae]
MKTSSLFLSVAIVTLATTLARATKCTTDELTTIASIYSSATSKGTAVCPGLMSTTDITASDYCSNSDCLQFMSDMLDGFPDCSSGGVNLKKGCFWPTASVMLKVERVGLRDRTWAL